jgi:hypothetical protein
MPVEDSASNHLPFEPNKKRSKQGKAINQIGNPPEPSKQPQQAQYTKEETKIPTVVSQRMLRRVAVFCGVPTALGIFILIASYLLISFADIQLPPIAVLLVNMGLFGLGVLGITYGVLSASWDEERPGNLLGLAEFVTNWGRMVEVWRETQKN